MASRSCAWAGRPRLRGRRSGVVLVLVLLVLLAVVALALALAREVRVEVAVAGSRRDEARLRALTASAVDRAIAELRLDEDPQDDLAATWRDNEAAFRGFALDQGRAWLLLAEPDPGDGREVRYGVRDEASRLNVNLATREQLLLLPGMTEDAADGILDWIDADDDVRDLGAESAYYEGLTPAYRAKNGPAESLEELLAVRGVDEALLWGEDRDRNGTLDPGEDDGDGSFPPDDADGELDRGIADYLTVFTVEPNVTRSGARRLDFNTASPDDIATRLAQAGLADAPRSDVVRVKVVAQTIASVGQLLQLGSVDEAAAAILLDELTVSDADALPGRINVNTAPRQVLAGLPGLEAQDVDAILTRRLEFDGDLSSPAWLLRVLPREKVIPLVDLVTTRSWQFSVHAVALLDGTPRFRRVEVLVDRGFVPVRVLLWRDVTGLGFPFPGERGEESP